MNKERQLSMIKTGFMMLGTIIGNKLGILAPAMLLLIFLMMVDYVSGMLASKKEAVEYPNDVRYGWSSRKSIIGIYKKVGYMLTVLVAVSTDYLIYKFLGEMGISYQMKTTFGLLVVIWLILNELLSILENASRMGAVLPQFVSNALVELKKILKEKMTNDLWKF